MKTTLAPLVPARAGTQGQVECYSNLDPRFRGGERTLSQRFGGNLRLVSIALMSALASLGMPSARAQERGPLNLARASYFFVGGKIDTTREGSPMIGQMYVEYMIPARRTHPYPIVMVHGGSQTGTNFTGTPDGREGWAQYFVRRGYSVYVVDQVARGRSPYWSQVYGPVLGPRFNFTEQRFVAPERSNQWPQAHLHTQWPGSGKAGDPAFDQFYASQFPSLASFPKQQELNRDALVALLDKVGPAILLTHLHPDHSNGLVDDEGGAIYRNAEIVLHANEASF